MKEEDSDTWFCYYALLKFHIRPKDYVAMDIYEKAIIQQFILEYLDKKRKEAEKIKSKKR